MQNFDKAIFKFLFENSTEIVEEIKEIFQQESTLPTTDEHGFSSTSSLLPNQLIKNRLYPAKLLNIADKTYYFIPPPTSPDEAILFFKTFIFSNSSQKICFINLVFSKFLSITYANNSEKFENKFLHFLAERQIKNSKNEIIYVLSRNCLFQNNVKKKADREFFLNGFFSRTLKITRYRDNIQSNLNLLNLHLFQVVVSSHIEDFFEDKQLDFEWISNVINLFEKNDDFYVICPTYEYLYFFIFIRQIFINFNEISEKFIRPSLNNAQHIELIKELNINNLSADLKNLFLLLLKECPSFKLDYLQLQTAIKFATALKYAQVISQEKSLATGKQNDALNFTTINNDLTRSSIFSPVSPLTTNQQNRSTNSPIDTPQPAKKIKTTNPIFSIDKLSLPSIPKSELSFEEITQLIKLTEEIETSFLEQLLPQKMEESSSYPENKEVSLYEFEENFCITANSANLGLKH